MGETFTYISNVSVTSAESCSQACSIRHIADVRVCGVDILVYEGIELLFCVCRDGFLGVLGHRRGDQLRGRSKDNANEWTRQGSERMRVCPAEIGKIRGRSEIPALSRCVTGVWVTMSVMITVCHRTI